MAVPQRMSGTSTITQMMRTERDAWIASKAPLLLETTWHRPMRESQVAAAFLSAGAVLAGARILLRLRLIKPHFAAGAFPLAAGLCAKAVRRQGRC